MTSATRPALERRASRVERQPISLRRRSARVVARLVVVAGFDAAAFLAARAAAGVILDPVATTGGVATRLLGPLAAPGAPASLVFPLVLALGLALSGSYARHRPSALALRLLLAVAAAVAATTVALAALIGVQGALLHSSAFGTLCAAALVAGRTGAQLVIQHVWPRTRGALQAARIGGPDIRAARETWDDYVIVDRLELYEVQVGNARDRLHGLSLRGIEAIVMTEDLPDGQLVPLVDDALDAGFRIIYPARAVPIEGIRPRLVWHRGAPFIEISTPVLRASAVFTKRVVDVFGSALLLVLTAPIIAAIALAIRLDSPGSVLFTQERAGLGGRRFRMLKFRTMAHGADDQKQELAHLNRSGDVRLFKIPGDPRVTRVGRFLRRWSLDELPQLINVLKGDMSLVGPRPFFESDFAAYEDRHFRRLDTKPGITGLWQVSGRSDVVDFEDVIFLDRQYIEQWSIWLDLSILIRTIPAVLRRDGAY